MSPSYWKGENTQTIGTNEYEGDNGESNDCCDGGSGVPADACSDCMVILWVLSGDDNEDGGVEDISKCY